MMTRKQMAAADKIVTSFKHDVGGEFSESYVIGVARECGMLVSIEDADVAIKYLMTEGLLYPTHVEREGKIVSGLRVL